MSVSNIFLKTYNPANIRFSVSNHWKGQTGQYKGFASFCDIDFGLRALIILIKNYIRKGYDTPAKIITRFAPSYENDTESYISFIDKEYIDKDLCISSQIELFALIQGICKFETGYILTLQVFGYVWNKFKISF